jgi:type III secretion system low calcium response chaperone LcrH/SycD
MSNKLNQYEQAVFHNIIEPVVDAAVKERPKISLETDPHFNKRLKEQLKHSFKQFQHRLHAAIKLLAKHGTWPADEQHQKAWEILKDHKICSTKLEQGETLQEVLHFSDKELQNIYAEGWELQKHLRHEDASNIFLLLTLLNPKVGIFWLTLGIAEEMRGELQEALSAYLLAAELEFHTLDPYIHAARCLLILKRKDEAKKVLHDAIERAEEDAELKIFKKDIEHMLRSI